MADPTANQGRTRWWEAGGLTVALAVALVAWWGPGALRSSDAPEALTHLTRAKTQASAGQADLELVELGKAVGSDPRSIEARLELGRALARRGNGAAAADELRVAMTLGEDHRVAVELGLLALHRNDNGAAVEWFERAAAIEPTSAIAHLDRAIALLRDGRAHEAVPACERVLELDPDNLDARHNLGFALRLLGQLPRAITELESVRLRAPDRIITLYELASAYADAGQLAQAVATFDDLLAREPGHGAAAQRRAELGALP